MKQLSITLIATAGLICMGGWAFAQTDSLQHAVARTMFAAQQQIQPYEVQMELEWDKDITLENLMLRAPRRPSRKEQVIYTKHKTTHCRGVLQGSGTQVLLPASCLEQGKYTLSRAWLFFQNMSTVLISPLSVQVEGEIARVEVPASATVGLLGLTAAPVPAGQSLQQAYGPDMTAHLQMFFREKAVPSCRVRRGVNKRKPTIRIGDALIYQGKVVALVKEEVSDYGGRFGGVSESAFAVIR